MDRLKGQLDNETRELILQLHAAVDALLLNEEQEARAWVVEKKYADLRDNLQGAVDAFIASRKVEEGA